MIETIAILATLVALLRDKRPREQRASQIQDRLQQLVLEESHSHVHPWTRKQQTAYMTTGKIHCPSGHPISSAHTNRVTVTVCHHDIENPSPGIDDPRAVRILQTHVDASFDLDSDGTIFSCYHKDHSDKGIEILYRVPDEIIEQY